MVGNHLGLIIRSFDHTIGYVTYYTCFLAVRIHPRQFTMLYIENKPFPYNVVVR